MRIKVWAAYTRTHPTTYKSWIDRHPLSFSHSCNAHWFCCGHQYFGGGDTFQHRGLIQRNCVSRMCSLEQCEIVWQLLTLAQGPSKITIFCFTRTGQLLDKTFFRGQPYLMSIMARNGSIWIRLDVVTACLTCFFRTQKHVTSFRSSQIFRANFGRKLSLSFAAWCIQFCIIRLIRIVWCLLIKGHIVSKNNRFCWKAIFVKKKCICLGEKRD